MLLVSGRMNRIRQASLACQLTVCDNVNGVEASWPRQLEIWNLLGIYIGMESHRGK